MRNDEIEGRIRDGMAEEDSIPNDRLIDRIIVRRRNGERVVLPVEPKRGRRPWIAAGIAAAALVLVAPLLQPREPSGHVAIPARMAPRQGESFMGPASLLAQSTATPSFAPLTSARGLREGRWTHGEMRDGKAKSTYTYALQHSEYQSGPAWLVVSTFREGEGGWSKVDSLWAGPDSVTPLFRVSHTDSIRTERTYRAEDILTGTTVSGYTSWKTEPLEDPLGIAGGPLYSVLRMPEIAIRLQSAALDKGWTGSLPFRGLGQDMKVHTFWLNFAVDGTEEIQVPGGRFDCWRIALSLGFRPQASPDSTSRAPMIRYWVSRDKQWLVRIGFNHAPPQVAAIELLEGSEE